MVSLFDLPEFSASLFFPRPDQTPTPQGARDLEIAVEPGVTLHARLHSRPGTRAVVLLFHGNGEVVADYDRFAHKYAERAAADLAVVDYRGYGRSGGAPTLRTCLSDAHRVLAAIREAIGSRSLIVLGRSLGGGAAAELACVDPAPAVGFVFESAAADIENTVRRRGIPVEGPLPEEDLAVFCPLRKLRRCTVPALVLHAERDQLIPAAEARRTFAALASERKHLVLIPGRGHNDVSNHPLYWDALGRFVNEVTP